MVHEGIRLTPARIANAALEEGVHIVGLSILSGSHMPLVKEVLRRMRELRRLAGKAPAQTASSMNNRQPSVSKIEQQADMYQSTLQSHVEAVGGTLDLVVSWPDRNHPRTTTGGLLHARA